MATLGSIQARIAKLQAQAEVLAAKKPTAVLERIRGLMDKHAVTIADIEAFVGKRRGRKPGATAAAKHGQSAAKYHDPKTGATWTGHGRAPGWIANAKDRSKFLVAGASLTAAPASESSAKVGNYVRGPQPAKYRDPKTGATWSGRGTAPAWLAGAKDRSRFLIAKTAEQAAPAKADKATSAKAAAAKKVTATKTVASRKATAKRAGARSSKSSRNSGAATQASAAPKARATKSAVTSTAPVESTAPQATTEVASSAAAA